MVMIWLASRQSPRFASELANRLHFGSRRSRERRTVLRIFPAFRQNGVGESTVALPREIVDGQFRRNILRFGTVVIATWLVSLLFTRLVAARLISALGSLEQQVIRLGEARPIDPALGAVAEINRMQHVLRDVGSNIATAEEAIERERSLLEATVQAMPIGVLLVTPEGRISLVNRKMLEIWKLDEKQSIRDQNELQWLHVDGTPYQKSEWPILQAIRFGKHIEGQEALSKVRRQDLQRCHQCSPCARRHGTDHRRGFSLL